jgi:DNA-binding NarL/FixJ family response regulator
LLFNAIIPQPLPAIAHSVRHSSRNTQIAIDPRLRQRGEVTMHHTQSDTQDSGAPARQTILLIDSEPLSRDCLAEALGRAFRPAGIIALSRVDDVPPDDGSQCILAVIKSVPGSPDTLMTDVKKLTQAYSGLPVVVIAACDQLTTAAAMEAGAQGLLPVSTPLRVGLAALQLVVAGGTYFPIVGQVHTQVAAEVGQADRRQREGELSARTLSPPRSHEPADASPSSFPELRPPGAVPVKFTVREAEVLAALQRGRSNKWIAGQLNLSENTVKVHIRHIMRKLHATNRTQAVVLSTTQLTGQPLPS